MNLHHYLHFNGQCEAAFNFYREHLGGQITAMARFGEGPAATEIPARAHHLIMHAALELCGQILMGTDGTTGEAPAMQGFHLVLDVNDPDEARRLFDLLADGGNVLMPLEETFWALRFGMLTDRFGVPWMINCDQGE